MATRKGPDEKQVADVGADDEQNKHRDNNQDLQGRKQMTGVIERSVPQRPDLDAAAAVSCGIFSFELRCNRGNFLLCLTSGHSKLKSHIRFTPSCSPIFQLAAAAIER